MAPHDSYYSSGFQPGEILPPREYLAMCGDIFIYHNMLLASCGQQPGVLLNIPQQRIIQPKIPIVKIQTLLLVTPSPDRLLLPT